MRGLSLAGIALTLLAAATPAAAHQVPFSYLDVRLDDDTVGITLVMHVVDVAHELTSIPPSVCWNRRSSPRSTTASSRW